MKKVVLSLGVLTLYLIAHHADVAAQETTTIQIAEYGIELTLPSRWKLSDLSEKNKPTRRQKTVLIVKATDDYGEANTLFYARQEHRKKR